MLIASGCSDMIKLHHWPSCEHAKTFYLPYKGYGVTNLSWCVDCDLIAYSTSSQSPPVMFTAKAEEIQPFREIAFPLIGTLCFSTHRRPTISLGSEDGQVMLYDIKDEKITRTLPVLPSSVRFLKFGAKDSILAAACSSGLICVYNPEYNVKATFYMPETERPITSIVCHPVTPSILSGATADGVVAVWDTNSGNCVYKQKMHIGAVNGVAFSFRDDIATVGNDCSFKCFDMRQSGQAFAIKADCKLTDVDFMSNDGEYIAVATADGKIYCYDRRFIANPLNTIIAHHPKPISKMAFQPFEIDDASNSSIDLSFTPASTRLHSGDFNEQHFFARDSNAPPYAVVGQDCLYKPHEDESDSFTESTSNVQLKNRHPVRVERSENDLSSCTVDIVEPVMPQSAAPVVSAHKKDAIAAITSELRDFTDEIVNKLVEYIDEEFLRIRLIVGKGFVDLESRIHSRWEKFGMSLFQFAAGDMATALGGGSCISEEVDNTTDDKCSSMFDTNRCGSRR